MCYSNKQGPERFARCPCSIKATCKYENIAPMGLTFEFDWTRFLEAATGPEQAVFPSETITIHDFLLCSPNTKLKQKRLRSNNRTDCTNEQSSNFRWEKPYPLSNKLEGRFRTPAELNHGAYLAPGPSCSALVSSEATPQLIHRPHT